MSEPDEPRERATYFYGDPISIRMTFTHDVNISAIEVIYTHHDDSSYRFILSGNPEPVEGSPVTGYRKRSTVLLQETADDSLIVGTYRATRIMLYTFSGRTQPSDPTGRWPVLFITMGSANIDEVSVELESE